MKLALNVAVGWYSYTKFVDSGVHGETEISAKINKKFVQQDCQSLSNRSCTQNYEWNLNTVQQI